jgi:F-type H+-transporting ATPase subunit a
MRRKFALKSFIPSLLALTLSVFTLQNSFAQEAHEGHDHAAQTEEFNPGETIMHHISDEHQWHFATLGERHVSLPLPVILYSAKNGLDVFSSSHFYHSPNGVYGDYKLTHEHITWADEATEGTLYDFSITKNVFSLVLSFVLLLFIFGTVAGAYRKNAGKAPKGLQSALEPFILFIRDEVARTYIGEKHYERFLPYLLTLFFFIWINNLLGLLPGGANLTGNIAVTMVLAVLTFLIVNFNGRRTYWSHIFAMPGVPKVMLLILTPVEIVGLLMRPFSLMVRLFANITAGHIILLSLLSMIFIFKTLWVSPVVAVFSVFMYLIELLVAVLQAYIFTVLTASYIGAAVEEHHHDEHH